MMALFRAMDQSLVGGKILLDGVDTATVPLTLLRNSIRYVDCSKLSYFLLLSESFSLVSQEPFLWHAPIREICTFTSTVGKTPSRIIADRPLL